MKKLFVFIALTKTSVTKFKITVCSDANGVGVIKKECTPNDEYEMKSAVKRVKNAVGGTSGVIFEIRNGAYASSSVGGLVEAVEVSAEIFAFTQEEFYSPELAGSASS